MRDMCLLKAEEEHFLQIANFTARNKVIGKVRRVAIYLDEKVEKLVPSKDERDIHLRSLSYFGSIHWIAGSKKLLRSMFKDFKDIEKIPIKEMKEFAFF